jgi:hypothetical protein
MSHHIEFLNKILHKYKYSQTCIMRLPLGQRKTDLVKTDDLLKRFNSYEIFYDSTLSGELNL